MRGARGFRSLGPHPYELRGDFFFFELKPRGSVKLFCTNYKCCDVRGVGPGDFLQGGILFLRHCSFLLLYDFGPDQFGTLAPESYQLLDVLFTMLRSCSLRSFSYKKPVLLSSVLFPD